MTRLEAIHVFAANVGSAIFWTASYALDKFGHVGLLNGVHFNPVNCLDNQYVCEDMHFSA